MRVSSKGSPPNKVLQFWKKLGGGSLALSIAIHVGLLFSATLLVTTLTHEKVVDFLPGGSSDGQKAASEALSHQIQAKKSQMHRQSSLQKIAVKSSLSEIQLPDAQTDMMDMPNMPNALGEAAAKMGAGSLAAGGFGMGKGPGIGIGNMKGTLFGFSQGKTTDLVGTMYDTKQDPKGKSRIKDPGNYYGDYEKDIAFIMDNKLSDKAFEPFYQVKRKLYLDHIFIPDMAADAGPAAFNAQDEVKPRMWFVHYTGEISPPERGSFRFVGCGDDVLIVLVDGKVVLDAGWANRYLKDTKFELPEPRVWPGLAANSKLAAGKWIRFDSLGRRKIDIIIGEHPGGRVHFALLMQQQGKEYAKDVSGAPILPLFTMAPLSDGEKKDLRDRIEKKENKVGFKIDLDNSPAWGVKQNTPRSLF